MSTNFLSLPVLILLLSSTASAVPITYTEEFFAFVGSFGGTPFTNSNITFQFSSDTNDIISIPTHTPEFIIENIPGTVTIAALNTTAVLTDQWTINATPAVNTVLFLKENGTFINIISPALSTYNLQTAIGPITGIAGWLDGGANTDQGGLVFHLPVPNGGATFTATTTPEPAMLVLFGLGLAGIAAVRRKGSVGR
jgi:hypothetical protein